jgi:saccharopine dehydrogenase-like NADP-dependent oxidoreductase
MTKASGFKRCQPCSNTWKDFKWWTLQPEDKDMIVMYHKFGYELDGVKKQIDSKMVCIGEDQTYTAMAKTVGLPVAMATLQILNGKITTQECNYRYVKKCICRY